MQILQTRADRTTQEEEEKEEEAVAEVAEAYILRMATSIIRSTRLAAPRWMSMHKSAATKESLCRLESALPRPHLWFGGFSSFLFSFCLCLYVSVRVPSSCAESLLLLSSRSAALCSLLTLPFS
jgi:hypothetical protein